MTLPELLARVEAATGPDPQLDGALDVALNGGDGEMYPARVTSSLDAAVALVERVLPGWRIQLFEDDDGWLCRVKKTSPYGLVAGDDLPRHKTAALALVAITLRALIAQAEPPETERREKG